MKLFSRERELKMIWRVQKDEKGSYLIGSAHIFPYSFKNSLKRFIKEADIVLLEGPLDEDSMKKVAEYGLGGEGELSFYLDPQTIIQINKELRYHIPRQSFSLYRSMVFGEPDVYKLIKGKKAWMAFFNIWYQYLDRRGWRYSVDREAFQIARELGKEIHFLESIEEQVKALDGIPLEKIASFLKRVIEWDAYARGYVEFYLKGDIEKLMSLYTNKFPVYCPSVIEKRDPILCERMKPFLKKGGAVAIVGAPHTPGIKRMLLEDGYELA